MHSDENKQAGFFIRPREPSDSKRTRLCGHSDENKTDKSDVTMWWDEENRVCETQRQSGPHSRGTALCGYHETNGSREDVPWVAQPHLNNTEDGTVDAVLCTHLVSVPIDVNLTAEAKFW